MQVPERLRSLKGIKWSRYPPSVLPAWVADMDYDPPEVVKAAIRDLVDRGDLGYNYGLVDQLVPTWCEWQEQRHGWAPDPGRVRPFTGAMHALEFAICHCTRPGDGVVVFTPIYAPFVDAIVGSGRRVVDVPLATEGWRLDPERLEASIDGATGLVLFSQPHNPVGRCFDRTELAALAEVCRRHDLLVVSDEIWGDLTYEPHRHLPLAVADERFGGRLVTLGSASKSFNLAGLRCAVAHIDDDALATQLAHMPAHYPGGPSTVSAAATLAAWREGGEWLEHTRVRLGARRRQLADRIAADLPAVGYTPPEATYLAWLDFRRTDLGENPSKRLLYEADVALEPGLKFGEPGSGWARLNFATSAEILDTVVDRIAERLADGAGSPGSSC